MVKEALRPAWAEINLKNLEYNIKQIQQKVGKDKEIIGVVKADAYGHGSVEVSKVLLQNNVHGLAIATLHEAIALRESGISCPILNLGLTPDPYASILMEYDITPVTASYENALELSKIAEEYGKVHPIIVAIDTGMGRIGFLPSDISIEEIKKIRELPNVFIKGIFSHFATADEIDKTYANTQLNFYKDFCE